MKNLLHLIWTVPSYTQQISNCQQTFFFKYSQYLTIYERPYAKEFVQKCHTIGDLVVFTTAVKDYTEKICEHLHIKPVELSVSFIRLI